MDLPDTARAADTPLRRGARRLIRRLRDAGHEALLAGGCVRDELLGVTPRDYDVATSAMPDEVTALFERSVPVGVQFGVVRVLLGGHEYEVSTFRADFSPPDGREPGEPGWSGAREDALRRDFTINGLLLDPEADGPIGRVVDHVGGVRDLRDGVVRAIGRPDDRFDDDPLRILRAVRFAARLGFRIDDGTWQAIRRRAGEVTTTSPERIRDELDRLLTEGGAARGLALLEASGLAPHVLPEIRDLATARARFAGHASPMPREVAWPTALLDVPGMPEEADVWGKRLRQSNALSRHTGRAVEAARRMARWLSLGIAARKRLIRSKEAPAALAACTLAALAGQAPPSSVAGVMEDRLRWGPADLRPPRLLTGADLKAAGYAPGPAFKDALEAVEDAWLEGRCPDRETALAVAREVLER
ncbi:MAG: CCA tRNA nucleotidyltransferase [Myxococcota bacterium]